jgi:hypothetical protein
MEVSELFTYQFRTDVHVLRYISAERTFYIDRRHFDNYAFVRMVDPNHITELQLTSHISGDIMPFTRNETDSFFAEAIIHNPGTAKHYMRRINRCYVKVV